MLESKKFSAASDCWAFGILLYEIWTSAETPYKGMNNHQVWVEVCNGELWIFFFGLVWVGLVWVWFGLVFGWFVCYHHHHHHHHHHHRHHQGYIFEFLFFFFKFNNQNIERRLPPKLPQRLHQRSLPADEILVSNPFSPSKIIKQIQMWEKKNKWTKTH